MEQIIILSATISVLLFGIIGIIDGFYFHLWKFKLHKHPETRFEHWTHTIRAAIFLGLLPYLLHIMDTTVMGKKECPEGIMLLYLFFGTYFLGQQNFIMIIQNILG